MGWSQVITLTRVVSRKRERLVFLFGLVIRLFYSAFYRLLLMAPKKQNKNKQKQTRIMSWTTTTLKLLQMSTVVLSGQERLGVAFTKQSKPYCCWPKVILAITRHFWQKRRTSVAYLSYCATFHGFELAKTDKYTDHVYYGWHRSTIDRLSMSRPTVGRQSVNSRSIVI